MLGVKLSVFWLKDCLSGSKEMLLVIYHSLEEWAHKIRFVEKSAKEKRVRWRIRCPDWGATETLGWRRPQS